MPKRARSAFAAALACLVVGATASAELQEGQPAPNFELPGSDGATYTLDQFRGKQSVVIAFFPKAFTGG